MRRAALIFAGMAAIIFALATMQPADAGYGAIAYDQNNGKDGASWNQKTPAEANEAALKLCASPDCRVHPVEVHDCLHLKSACSYIGSETILLNRAWVDAERLHGFELLDVPRDEPAAANVLLLNDILIMPGSFPKTVALLEKRGFRVRTIDVSELQKAEAGVTCCSLIFKTLASG